MLRRFVLSRTQLAQSLDKKAGVVTRFHTMRTYFTRERTFLHCGSHCGRLLLFCVHSVFQLGYSSFPFTQAFFPRRLAMSTALFILQQCCRGFLQVQQHRRHFRCDRRGHLAVMRRSCTHCKMPRHRILYLNNVLDWSTDRVHSEYLPGVNEIVHTIRHETQHA